MIASACISQQVQFRFIFRNMCAGSVNRYIVDTGPMRIRDQFLLGMGFLAFDPVSADVQEKDGWQFDTVLTAYDRSDKTPSALLKKGYAYLELGQREQGVVQLQSVIRQYPQTDEADLARQRLQTLGVDGG